MKRTIQCKHSINIDKCSECYPIFLKETTVTTTEQPNEQWLTQVIATYLEGLHNPNEDGLYNDLRAKRDTDALKSAIFKHTRSVEAIEAVLQYEGYFVKGELKDATYMQEVRNELRAEIRAALELDK